jgi:EmrB/QacA subfamily drug resistance transporter
MNELSTSSAGDARVRTRLEGRGDPRRWMALAFIALAQLMVALDATIVSIALPSAQAALHVSAAQRQWVITAYTLSFGGLLLLGGRIADSIGRRRAFLVGLAGFAAASALSGAAVNLGMLVAARALQGAFGALLAPTALSLLAVTFTEPRERAKAFAVYGGIAGSGAAVGLVSGGVLTQFLDWRWCLYVNVPIAAIAAIGARVVLADNRPAGKPRFDVPGVVLASGGLVALVYACSQAVSHGWASSAVILPLAAAVALLGGFLFQESHADNPLLPLHIVADRNRGGAYLSVALSIVGMFGAFLLLTYYFQAVLRYSPLEAGLAFLPMTAAMLFSSWAIASRLLPFVAPRALMIPGALVAGAGMALLSGLHVGSAYPTHVLPAELLLGLGIANVMVPAFSIATQGVEPREAGVASAMVNTASQIGGSIGTALLNTIAATATAAYLSSRSPGPLTVARGLVHGYSVATAWAAGILVLAAVVAATIITARRPTNRDERTRPAAGPSTRLPAEAKTIPASIGRGHP